MHVDITQWDDIKTLIEAFYDKILRDPVLAPVFVDVAGDNLEHHIDMICDFWDTALFQSGRYKGAMLQAHIRLNNKMRLTDEHFDLWLQYFQESVNELYYGDNAELIKSKARTLSTIMRVKLDEIEKRRLELNN